MSFWRTATVRERVERLTRSLASSIKLGVGRGHAVSAHLNQLPAVRRGRRPGLHRNATLHPTPSEPGEDRENTQKENGNWSRQMFTLRVDWGVGWERSLTTEPPSQEKSLPPSPGFIKPQLFKELGAITATSLHRQVTKSYKSWENQGEEKSRGWRGRGRFNTPKRELLTSADTPQNYW